MAPASALALTFGNLGIGVLVGASADGTVGAQNTTNLDRIVENGDTPVEATLRFDPATRRPVAAWRWLPANAIATSAREPPVAPGRR